MATEFNPPPLYPFDADTPKNRLILLFKSRSHKTVPWIGTYVDVAGGGWHAVDPWTGGCRPIPIEQVIGWSELAIDTTLQPQGPPE